MKVATYLDFNGNAKDVIETYRSIFDAEVVCEYLFDENTTQDPNLLGKIFHAELIIGDLNLYLSDSSEEFSVPSMKFVVELRDERDARRIIDNLEEHGQVVSDFKKMPYGPTIAQADDKFGMRWEIVIC